MNRLPINPLVEWAGALVYAVPGEVLRSFGGTRPLTFAYTSLSLRF